MGQLVLKIIGLLAALFVKDSFAVNNLLPDTRQCGQQLEDRISGGSKTHIDEYPWVALIETEYRERKRYKCAGSLINNRYVLTAAHCVKDINVTGVRLGEWDIFSDPDCEEFRNGDKSCADPYLKVGIEQIHVHPDYQVNRNFEGPFQYNDIALIRLDCNINFTDFIQPICLPVSADQRSQIFDGIAMQVAGWGFTETGFRSREKKKVTVPGFEFESCRKKYRRQGVILQHPQMCAGGEMGKDACINDSGGPLMMKQRVDSRDVYVLIGMVSFGFKTCGDHDFPGVYTGVGAYMDWIESLLQP